MQTLRTLLPSKSEAVQAVQPQPTTSVEHLKALYSPNIQKRELYAQILLVIGEVENTKQIHITEEERKALAVNLTNLGKPIEEIIQMGENVKRTTTYAKIPLEAWLNAEPLYTHSEAREMAEMIIRKRQQSYIDMQCGAKWSVNQLAEEGLYELTGLYYAKRAEEWERIMDKIKPFIKSLLDTEGRIK